DYFYRVAARNEQGNSVFTTANSARLLEVPAILSVDQVNAFGVFVHWTLDDPTVTGFDVMASTDGTHFTNAHSTTLTNWTFAPVLDGTRYWLQIRAHFADGGDSSSNV